MTKVAERSLLAHAEPAIEAPFSKPGGTRCWKHKQGPGFTATVCFDALRIMSRADGERFQIPFSDGRGIHLVFALEADMFITEVNGVHLDRFGAPNEVGGLCPIWAKLRMQVRFLHFSFGCQDVAQCPHCQSRAGVSIPFFVSQSRSRLGW